MRSYVKIIQTAPVPGRPQASRPRELALEREVKSLAISVKIPLQKPWNPVNIHISSTLCYHESLPSNKARPSGYVL